MKYVATVLVHLNVEMEIDVPDDIALAVDGEAALDDFVWTAARTRGMVQWPHAADVDPIEWRPAR